MTGGTRRRRPLPVPAEFPWPGLGPLLGALTTVSSPAATDTSWVVPVDRFRTNTSLTPLPSSGTRSSASLTNTTTEASSSVPLAIDESPAPPTPSGVPLTSSWRHGWNGSHPVNATSATAASTAQAGRLGIGQTPSV
jgi:hypothetical protein